MIRRFLLLPAMSSAFVSVMLAGSLILPAGTLIVNGSFENVTTGWQITDPDHNFSTSISSSTKFGAGSHSGDYYVWGGDTTPEGVDPGVPHTGIVQQSGIATQQGVNYTLSFWLRNIPSNGNPINQLEVHWNNFGSPGSAPVLAMANIVASANYQQYWVDVVGGANPGELTFELYNGPTALLLDDVSLTETVPEPDTWRLLGAGLLRVGIGKLRGR